MLRTSHVACAFFDNKHNRRTKKMLNALTERVIFAKPAPFLLLLLFRRPQTKTTTLYRHLSTEQSVARAECLDRKKQYIRKRLMTPQQSVRDFVPTVFWSRMTTKNADQGFSTDKKNPTQKIDQSETCGHKIPFLFSQFSRIHWKVCIHTPAKCISIFCIPGIHTPANIFLFFYPRSPPEHPPWAGALGCGGKEKAEEAVADVGSFFFNAVV